MKSLPGERELIRTNGGILVLTSHRVRLDQQEAGRSQVVSIMLDEVASCGLITKNYPVILLLALIVALSAVWLRQYVAAALFGGFLAALYFFSPKAILSIASSGAAIEIAASGLSRQTLVEFIDSVEEAKLAYCRASVAAAPALTRASCIGKAQTVALVDSDGRKTSLGWACGDPISSCWRCLATLARGSWPTALADMTGACTRESARAST